MAVELSPVGLSAAPVANRLSLLATYREKLCRCICVNSGTQPQGFVSYTYESPTLQGTTIFIPIVARVTIVSPGCGCEAIPQVYTERFMVAFQDYTALPTAVTITSEGTMQGLTNVRCGKSNCYAIYDSIAITITPGTATTPATA